MGSRNAMSFEYVPSRYTGSVQFEGVAGAMERSWQCNPCCCIPLTGAHVNPLGIFITSSPSMAISKNAAPCSSEREVSK